MTRTAVSTGVCAVLLAAAALPAAGCGRSSALGEPCDADGDCETGLVCSPTLEVCVKGDLPDGASGTDAGAGTDAASPPDGAAPGTDTSVDPGTDAKTPPMCFPSNEMCSPEVGAPPCCEDGAICCAGGIGEPPRCHLTCN